MRRGPNPLFTVLLGLLPWPAVYIDLYILHSVWWAFGFYHGLCLVCCLCFRNPLPRIPEIVWRRRQWLYLGIACLAVNAVVYFGAGLLGKTLQPHRISDALTKISVGHDRFSIVTLFLYFAFANPIFEEFFWRSTIFGRLREANLPPVAAAAISGILFGGWHSLPIALFFSFPLSLIAVVGIMAIGYLLARFYDRSRSLAATIAIHALGADLPILILLYLDVLRK